MKKMLVSILVCLIFFMLACHEDKRQPVSETGWSDEKIDESLPQKPVLAKDLEKSPLQKMVLPQKFIDALSASRKVWENLKKESNNTYSYQLESGVPGWTPNRYQTIIEIEQGSLADYTVTPIAGSINDEMRKHFPAKKTLDELYDECENKIIPNLMEDQWFVLDFFTNGILASCSYDTCGLIDSAGEGIKLKALALQRTKNFGPHHSVRSGGLSYKCKK